MAIFSNQATLTYNGNSTNSNIAYGEILDVLVATKTAVEGTYTPGALVTYVVTLRNTGNASLTGLTVTDDLGGYDFTISNNFKYEYMKELVSLTDAAVDILAQNLDTKLRRGYIEMDETIFYDFGATSQYGCLYYDNRYDLYYICMTKECQGHYLNSKYKYTK